jgi:hypothetical protein
VAELPADVHVHLHVDLGPITVNHVVRADAALLALIDSIKGDFAMVAANVQAAIDQLTADVAAETTANAAAITLINGFATELAAAVASAQAAGATPAQLQALSDLSATVEANSAALATAVTANTPAAPAPDAAAAAPAAAAPAPAAALAGGATSDVGSS